MSRASRLKAWATGVKAETDALYIAVRDARTPWYAKALGVCVVSYALSPIDLIPDFIPVLGYLDDVVIIAVGLWTVRRLIPPEVLVEARQKVGQTDVRRSWAAAAIIVAMWVAATALTAFLLWRRAR